MPHVGAQLGKCDEAVRCYKDRAVRAFVCGILQTEDRKLRALSSPDVPGQQEDGEAV